MIEETLKLLKDCGLDLQLCPDFSGIKESPRGQYFNVLTQKAASFSHEMDTLYRLKNKGIIADIESNGWCRAAIWPNIKKTAQD